MPLVPEDAFPPTLNTWLRQKLEEGEAGRTEINRHLMAVYSWPLQVYFRGSSERWLGEAEDLVQGFFADRLARKDFLDAWQESGLRLRRWLMNAFCFYLKEVRRRRRKESREEDLPDDREAVFESPEVEIDRAFAVALVRRALDETRHLCESRGLGEHWEVFHLHYYQGLPYSDIIGKLGMEQVRASTMARTVAGKFRTTLREMISRDGAQESEINSELECLLQAAS